MKPNKHVEYMTYSELLKFFGKNNSEEQVHYVSLSDGLPFNNEYVFPTEEEIYNYIIDKILAKNIRNFEKESKNRKSSFGRYLRENPIFLSYVTNNAIKIDFSSMDFNVKINESVLIIRINKGNITIQGVDVIFVRENVYKVDIYDIPVTKYSLEQLKHVSRINSTKEPRIPLRLNPGITRQDVKKEQQMVKKLRK